MMAARSSVTAFGSALGRCGGGSKALWRDGRGIAALEFALLVPALVTASIGIYAASQALRVRLLLGTTATSMVDLVASQTAVTPPTLLDFCSNGAANSMLPYNTKVVGVTVARYTKPAGAAASGPDWTNGAACPKPGPTVGSYETSLANGILVNDGDVVILVKATYLFVPTINFYTSAATLSITRYQKARNNGAAACTSC